MARNRLRGDSLPVAQVDTVQITAAGAAGDTVIVTINRKTVTYTVQTGDTAALIAAGVAAACTTAAGTLSEFEEITWTSVTDKVYATATNAGFPFTITSVTVTGTTTVGAITNVTASAGLHHWDDPKNWTAGTIPATGEDVDLQDCATDIWFGVAQSGVTLASLNIDSTFTGDLGLPQQNPAGYYEYRQTYLAIGATKCNIGGGQGAGVGRCRIDFGSVQTTLVVYSTGNSQNQGQPAVFLKGSHASNAITIVNGSVGAAFDLGSALVAASFSIGGDTTSGAGPNVIFGQGVSITTLLHQAGSTQLLPGTSTVTFTTVTTDGGTLTLTGTVNITTLNGKSGTIHYDANGTIGTTILNRAILDHSREPKASKIMTNTTMNAGSSLLDPAKKVTFSTPITLNCRIEDVTLRLGDQIAVQRT